MAFLPSRVLSWRYGRGSRSLEETLANKVDVESAGPLNNRVVSAEEASEEEGFDLPEEIEDIIGQLLNGLRDKDTVVRWTAAKGWGQLD